LITISLIFNNSLLSLDFVFQRNEEKEGYDPVSENIAYQSPDAWP